MQNKGVIRLFAILLALVCLYQLSFTFFTKRVETKAKEYAHNEVAQKQAEDLSKGNELNYRFYLDSVAAARESFYLDSMSNETVYNFLFMRKFSYKDCKAREINLGLDLKGGMNVMMEVSTVDVVRALANHTTDPIFNQAIEMAIEKQRVSNGDFVTLFGESIKQIDPNVRLAGYFSTQLRDKIKLADDNNKVLSVVKKETTDAFDRTYQILRQRIDKFGVAQPNIQKLQSSERILIELPGVKEPERVRKLLQGTAQLEFWLTYDFGEVFNYINEANDYLASVGAEEISTQEVVATAEEVIVENDSTVVAEEDALLAELQNTDTDKSGAEDQFADEAEWKAKNPLYSRMQMNIDQQTGTIGGGPVVGYAPLQNKKEIDRLLQIAKDKKIIPSNVRFLWDAKPLKGTDAYALYAINVTTRDGSSLLGGEVITDARQDFDNNGNAEISMSMNAEGAKEWKKITGANIGKCVAIVLDDVVYSAPNINVEISGGRSSISGSFSVEEAKDLANILKAGKLPAPAIIVQEAVVGPSLGEESIRAGFISFILAFIMVLIYMVVFYNRAGMLACIALIANVFFLFGVLASLGAVLTLPGIAGIVLTMAMAVDANVIINERIKEELRLGKSLASAVADGYKNAYSAIIDGNVTTFLVGVVLIIFGTGPVQGFAVTLTIGILTSLFTSVLITRLNIDLLLNKKKNITFSFKFSENFLSNTKIDFVGSRKKGFIIFGIIAVLCLGSLTFKGMSYGIDFRGGRTFTVRFDQNVATNDLRQSLAEQFEGDAPEVKTFGGNSQVKITTKYKINEDTDEVKKEVVEKLYNGAKGYFTSELTLSEFSTTLENPLGIISEETVGPTIANDIKRSSVIAVIVALLMMFLYISARFKKWQFGSGAVLALVNVTLIVLGVFSIFTGILPFNMDVDQTFIAAVLTVIGYAINDTVIVFDRVREYMKLYPKRDLKSQMNDAINSTLSRTVNTSGSTLIVILMIFIFGGEVIRGFTFALLIGVIAGIFSTLFIACPIGYEFLKRKQDKLEAKAK